MKVNRMTKLSLVGVLALGFTALLAVSGCTAANERDLEGVNIQNPAKAEIYANLDGHPNIVRLCVDGVALLTTTRELDGVQRIPEWDAWCKS